MQQESQQDLKVNAAYVGKTRINEERQDYQEKEDSSCEVRRLRAS